jgi:hypothetical protein
MITALGNQEPIGPGSWEEGAALAVSKIFEKVDVVLRHSTENAFSEDLIKIQFEGMFMSSQCFDSDEMYWAEEWRILGSIAAAAGMKNLVFSSLVRSPEAKEITSKFKDFSNAQMRELCSFVLETLCKKQHDYGHENIARFGRLGLLVRVHDKIARLKNLVTRGGVPQNESIEDTYVDILGYSAIGIMVERGWFGLQLSN